MRLTKTVLDCSTNTTSVVELTDEEIAEIEATALEQQARLAELAEIEAIKEANKESAKSKLCKGRLPLGTFTVSTK